MADIIIIGGGWGGCAAAVSARKAGADVMLLERTDMLLGTGLVGGIMRNNGRYTAAEELIALGAGDLIDICDRNSRHKNIEFPHHKHASLYDIVLTHGELLRYMLNIGIKVLFKTRISGLTKEDLKIINVKDDNGNVFEAKLFIDATGTAGPMNNCTKYGNGCAMCIMRCPSFKGRVSVLKLAGIKEYEGKRQDGSTGSMSGSCKIFKESLSYEIQDKLNKEGVAIIPIPPELVEKHLDIKACRQYALKEFEVNIILLDTGHAKLMAPFYDLEILRKIPGFENARYEDPYAGGKGNSIRFLAMAPRDNYMKVNGIYNLFCCGEKAGPIVGHTEAICTGSLAGCNAVRQLTDLPLLSLSKDTAIGDLISFVNEKVKSEEGRQKRYTFAGAEYFKRMEELNLYTTNKKDIEKRIDNLNLTGIMNKKLM